jgi:hypothetical protein
MTSSSIRIATRKISDVSKPILAPISSRIKLDTTNETRRILIT